MLDRIHNYVSPYMNCVQNIYMYGSRVYETHNHNSDYDFIVVGDTSFDNEELRRGDVNIHMYSPEKFQNLIDQHSISSLECFFAPDNKKLKETVNFSFELNKSILRKSISEKASNSWVKCKKKLTVEPDEFNHIGLKSLFHSFRIIEFGIQIAKEGYIYDYSAANHYYDEIIKLETQDWEILEKNFKERHNNKISEFRKLAPKK